MPVTDRHYTSVREFFKWLLGGECYKCGTLFNLEFHHPEEPLITKKGRGRDVRMWGWFEAYQNGNLELLCRDCHMEEHKKREDDGDE